MMSEHDPWLECSYCGGWIGKYGCACGGRAKRLSREMFEEAMARFAEIMRGLSEEEIDARIEADRVAHEYSEQRAALDWAEEDRADEAYDTREDDDAESSS